MSGFIKYAAVCGIINALTACGGDSDPTPTAQSCFDSSTYTPGTVINQRYTSTSTPSNVFNMTIEPLNQKAEFNNTSGLMPIKRRVYTEIPIQDSLESYQETVYIEPVTSLEVIEHGYERSTATGVWRMEDLWINNPPVKDKKFTLKAGESFEYQTVARVTRTFPEAIKHDPLAEGTSDIHYNIKTTFSGIEEIKIGSRTVKACKFKTKSLDAPLDDSSDWFYRGILIQSTDPYGKISMETLEFTRNGQNY